jgi:hypothetical protein
MTRLALSMLVLAMIGHVEGARIKAHNAAGDKRIKADQSTRRRKNENAGFNCPDECQECCAASWVKFTIPNFGRSADRFKCILKAKIGETDERMPSDRVCTTPRLRNKAKGDMAKTECDYSPEEKEANAYKLPSLKWCSDYSACCCQETDDWTEDTCSESGVDNVIQKISKKRGSMESWKKADQTYDNKDETCQRRDSVRHAYQTGPKAWSTDQGCCTRTRQKSYTEEYECGEHIEYRTIKGQCHPVECEPNKPECQTKKCDPDTQEPYIKKDYCTRTKIWQKCVEWEQLYFCSHDGGVRQNGYRYRRFSTKPGECIADTANPFRDNADLTLTNYRCPAGYTNTVAGNKCRCASGCGDNYR